MGPCDLKTSAKAWNDGITAFQNAFLLSENNDPSKAIKYALEEIKKSNPSVDFLPESFYSPIIDQLKAKGIIDKNYSYTKEKITGIEKALNKFKVLNDPDKKKMAESLSKKKGVITERDVKNSYAELKGLPSFTPELNKIIDQAAEDRKAYESATRKVKDTFAEIQEAKKDGKLTPELDKEYSDKLSVMQKEVNVALENYLKSDLALGEHLSAKRHWVYQYGDIMKMNLMTPVSILKNTTGMVGDAIFRNMSNLVAAPLSMATLGVRRALGKTNASVASTKIISKTAGAFKGQAALKAKLYSKYGTEPVYSDKLRTPNFADGARNLRKAMEGDKTFFNTAAAIFKISPSIITRGLGSPDFFFQEMSETGELNRIGLEKGYTGAELKAFIMAPDEKSLQIAKDYAKQVTYKQDLGTKVDQLLQFDFAKVGDNMIANGYNPILARFLTGVAHAGKNVISPFIKTPINLLRAANKIVLPEWTLLTGLNAARKETNPDEKTNKAISAIADATVGFHIRAIALNMVVQGLISAGYDDEEQKTKEIVEKKAGGSNRVNVNALWRGLTMQEVKEMKGDRYVDINALGTLGIALGAYAHAYNQYGRKDQQAMTDYLKGGNFFSIPANAAMSELSSSLDFTFFSGWNDFGRALRNEKGYERNKWLENSLMTVIGGILPSTHQLLSKAAEPERKKAYEKDLSLSENIYNALGYRFAFNSFGDASKNYNVFAGNEGASKKKDYYLFDNYWGRLLASADPFKSKIADSPNTPVYKLYEAMRMVEKDKRDDLMPSPVKDEVNVGSKSNPNNKALSKQQHEYLQNQGSIHNMLLATPFIMSKDFDNADYDTKVEVLQGLYKKARTQAIKDLKEAFPDIKKRQPGEKKKGKTSKALLNKYD